LCVFRAPLQCSRVRMNSQQYTYLHSINVAMHALPYSAYFYRHLGSVLNLPIRHTLTFSSLCYLVQLPLPRSISEIYVIIDAACLPSSSSSRVIFDLVVHRCSWLTTISPPATCQSQSVCLVKLRARCKAIKQTDRQRLTLLKLCAWMEPGGVQIYYTTRVTGGPGHCTWCADRTLEDQSHNRTANAPRNTCRGRTRRSPTHASHHGMQVGTGTWGNQRLPILKAISYPLETIT
jgi:hypothetical protein